MSIKALAAQVLQGNQLGNRGETCGFLAPENMKPEPAPRETSPGGLTPAGPEAAEVIELRKATVTRSADQFTPAERARFCLDHQNTYPAGHCPHLRELELCVLWQAILARRSVYYLAAEGSQC